MTDRLHRIRLLLGDEKLQKLQNSTVMVFGCGAVGSFAIESLARSGVGNIVVIDFDTVDETNINRQLFALDSTTGQKKVQIAKQRILDINPQINVTALDMFFDKNSKIDIIPDFVIDAIDSVQSKIALYRWCQKNKIPFISSMGAARKTDPTKIKIDKISRTFACPLAATIRKKVRELKIHDFSVVFSTETAVPHHKTDKDFGSIITVTGTFGLVAANYAIQHLIK